VEAALSWLPFGRLPWLFVNEACSDFAAAVHPSQVLALSRGMCVLHFDNGISQPHSHATEHPVVSSGQTHTGWLSGIIGRTGGCRSPVSRLLSLCPSCLGH
jgi:hypothetical protein